MDPDPPKLNPAHRLHHLTHYANKSHLAAHLSTASKTIIIPRDEAALHETYHTSVAAETERIRALIAREREKINQLPHRPPPQPYIPATTLPPITPSTLNHLLTLQHTLLHPSPLPPPLTHLPSPTSPTPSPLPPLLLQSHLLTHLTTIHTTTLPTLRNTLSTQTSQLTHLTNTLTTSHHLTTTLRDRIDTLLQSLHHIHHTSTKNADEQTLTTTLIAQNSEKITRYGKAQRTVLRGMKAFVETYLGGMLVEEELGGAVVGEDVTAYLAPAEQQQREKGQRGIREMLVPSGGGGRKRALDGDDDGDAGGAGGGGGSNSTAPSQPPRSKPAIAAANELKTLIEALMNASVTMADGGYVYVDAGRRPGHDQEDDEEDGSTNAVPPGRESAAARFLVRAGVAQFHKRDARRVKLVDFGRAVED